MSYSRRRRKPVVQDVESVNQNIFSKPWKKSDVVLVVQGKQFHVHRSILMMQSPVFEAMLNGNFKEANEKKITLRGKTSEDMLQFLKLLYPQNMTKTPLISFTDDRVLDILVLADEYQAESVMNQCLERAEITPNNAVKIIPYAREYNKSVHDKCFEVIKRSTSTDILEKELPGPNQPLVQELLTAKCRHLEKLAITSKDMIVTLLAKTLGRNDSKSSSSSSTSSSDSSSTSDEWDENGYTVVPTAKHSCDQFHDIDVRYFHQIRRRNCKHCLQKYRKVYVEKALRPTAFESTSKSKQLQDELFSLLEKLDDVC